MITARGKTKEVLVVLNEVEKLIAQAASCIDTSEQYRIRTLLEAAIKRCQDVRNEFDPV